MMEFNETHDDESDGNRRRLKTIISKKGTIDDIGDYQLQVDGGYELRGGGNADSDEEYEDDMYRYGDDETDRR